mmetsp:Transcript_2568/g.3965  ORF Transcript_2568/g.3965 Transcript_2568/m.3965 type:complete len:133 (+) Transcript_2568:339-737(+)
MNGNSGAADTWHILGSTFLFIISKMVLFLEVHRLFVASEMVSMGLGDVGDIGLLKEIVQILESVINIKSIVDIVAFPEGFAKMVGLASTTVNSYFSSLYFLDSAFKNSIHFSSDKSCPADKILIGVWKNMRF